MGVWNPGPGATDGADTYTGTDSLDIADGLAGDDVLLGFGSVDRLDGGFGDDFVDGGSDDDILSGGPGDDTVLGGDGNDWIWTIGDGDEMRGGAGADSFEMEGGGIGDSLYGEDGNDQFLFWHRNTDDPLAGYLDGGAGDDVLALTYGRLGAVSYNSIESIYLSWSSSGMLVIDPGSMPTSGTLYSQDGRIQHASGGVTDISGLTILDHQSIWHKFEFWGSSGGDTFIYAPTSVLILRADGGLGNDTIRAGAAADELYGGDGNDTLDGGAGVDALIGGDGNDTYVVDNANDSFTETPTGGIDTVEASFNYTLTLFAFVENLTLIGTAVTGTGSTTNNIVTGNAGDNQLFGMDGVDTLFGGDGDDLLNGGTDVDSMAGGGGSDTYVVDNASDAMIETSTGGVDTVQSLITHTLGANLENLVLIGSATITGNGNALDNVITGNGASNSLFGFDGADILDGSGGGDQMRGGLGNDAYYVNDSFDTVVELAGEGTDTVYTSLNLTLGYTLGANLENLTLIGAADLYGVGNASNNTIIGNAGTNTIDGGAGADVMFGGAGDDTYVADDAGDTVTEGASVGTDVVQASVTFALTANIENLTLTGAAAINGFGNILNNAITGNGAANQLNGFDGNDTLDGGAGADNMFGGNGDDLYFVDNAGDVTSEASALGGADMVFSSVNRNLTANIEHLTLLGAAITGAGNSLNNAIAGNEMDNTLYGFDGDDVLNGNLGADSLFGANGDDTYIVDNAGDITVEGSALGGVDTVQSSISRNLNANFENLMLLGAAQFGYGNVLNNVMTGNAAANGLYGFDGNDTLDGGAGADQMFGANGDDLYIVDNASDVTSEVSALGGTDTVQSSVTRNLTANLENLVLTGSADITGAGNVLANTLTGNAGVNTLYGLDGADTLDGGLGADTLQGGLHADSYVFNSALGGGNVDAIVGFNVADDTIVLNNAVFTGLANGTLDASAFVIGSAAADADDRIIYNSATGQLSFDADGDGAGAAVVFATLAPGLALTNSDFIVSGP